MRQIKTERRKADFLSWDCAEQAMESVALAGSCNPEGALRAIVFASLSVLDGPGVPCATFTGR
jgi:hypothetical protein